MDAADDPDVMEEVEALFKKLQHLPESVRQKALSCIQKKLPDAQPEKTTPKRTARRGPGLRSDSSETSSKLQGKEIPSKDTSLKKTNEKDSHSNPTSGLKKEAVATRSRSQSQESQDEEDHAENVSTKIPEKENQGQNSEKVRLPFRLRVKKDLLNASSELKSSVSDDESSGNIIEDVKTLHGRRTKRINVANLIKGTRKTKVIPSSPVKSAASKDKQLSNTSKKDTPLPSDVAESAEILASLSNEISQKDLTQGMTAGVEQTDYLKDKTNNQDCEASPSATTDGIDGTTLDINIKLESETEIPVENDEESEDDPLTEISAIEEDPGNSKSDFTCHFCDFTCTTKSTLSAHVRKHKENIPKGPFVCSECNKTFSQACGLQLHMKRHRGERDFHCANCDYKAFTKVDLSRHQTIHTGERNKICEYCGKAFAKDSTLRDHVKAIHERKITHECDICGFVTHRANNLRVHIRMRHHGEYNNHVCPVCGASVKQKNAFLEHMRSHTGERPYKCDECTASFACLARLNVHRNAVHGERLFKCGDCDKCFQTKHHLLRHHAIHTKERPYACPFCSYACNTQGNIAKHVRSIHNCPDFSYRKYKSLQENGGQPREVDPEWVRKGEEVTKEYLNSLSEKMGRPITLDELWTKEKEMQKKKEDQEKARLALKEQKAAKAEAAGTAYLSKVKRRRVEEKRNFIRKGKQGQREAGEEDVDDPSAILLSETETDGEGTQTSSDIPFYKLVSQASNIQLCLETDEVQVYTGDATRELSLLQMKNNEDLTASDQIQTIQGYMNEDGQFIRLEEGMMVNEDGSTVVVIIDADMNEGLTPEVADVMEITCEEGREGSGIKRCMETELEIDSDNKRKKSVIRVIKQED